MDAWPRGDGGMIYAKGRPPSCPVCHSSVGEEHSDGCNTTGAVVLPEAAAGQRHEVS